MYKSTKPKKETKVENIKEYQAYKQLYFLTKKHSSQSTIFVEDLIDPWFVYVITYKTKSGIITDNSMIIKSDCDTRIKHLINVGHELKK